MRIYAIVLTFALLFGSNLALASENSGGGDDGHNCPSCHQPTKKACFNLKCDFHFKDDHHGFDCVALSTFNKDVTLDGGEVADSSESSHGRSETPPTPGVDDGVKLEVSCEGLPIWNNPARRYTDLLGTRIQGQEGPDPALILPRGELHANSNGSGHYSPSVLELQTDEGFKRSEGQCFIWTGNP